jgi:cyclase
MKFARFRPTATAALIMVAGASVAAPAAAADPIWDANKVQMISETLAPGVFAFYASNAKELNAKGAAAATSAGLIVGSKASLQIDTLLNRRLHGQVQALVRKATPKPVTFAVNTSAHGDHSFGNMYLAPSTLIVQHVQTKRYIERHLEDDKAFMIKYFGTGRGIEPITARAADIVVPAGGRVTLELGGKRAEIIDFGFAQTGGDLFVWEPDAKVLWAGNAIIAAKPSLPWLLDGHLIETLATLRKVHEFLPPDARIVPGHGVVMGREALQWHLDYLAAVKAGVEQAIAEGLSLEQTVKRVALPEFRGYALFDWVHPGLNVPAAYKDLSAPKR